MRMWLLGFLLVFWTAGLFAAPVILVHGDSLSAAYGIPREQGWVSLLERRLGDNGHGYRVVNSSVSGETTAGGLSRLPALLDAHRPALLVLALGANDGLRGLPPAQMRANLVAMVKQAKRAGAQVLLVGMHLPPNYGPAYATKFHAVFRDVAQDQKVSLVPFLLDGMATRPERFLPDGLHPNTGAQPVLLDNVWQKLAPMLRR